MIPSILSVLALAAAATAKTIVIDVAETYISFEPNTTTADVGDVLEFHFYTFGAPHTVAESTFETPCVPTSDSFFSGFINGTSTGSDVYSVTVATTDPIWYYCSAHSHCQYKMVGVVNPPSNATLEMYVNAAEMAMENVSPATTMISGTYSAAPTPTSSMSASSGASSPTTEAGATPVSTAASGMGAMKTADVMGLMAAGGLGIAALMM